MVSLGGFHVGLASMAPVGVWLPWAEVVALAAPWGWAREACADAASVLVDLGAAEVEKSCGVRGADSEAYVRVRLLPVNDEDGMDGVLSVSSSESEDEAVVEDDVPSTPLLQQPSCSGSFGMDIDMPLPASFQENELALLPVFFNLWSLQEEEKSAGITDGLGVDIPAWAAELFGNGLPWTKELVQDFCSLRQDSKAVQSGEGPGPASQPSASCASTPRAKKPTRWGRCAYPTCSGRALKPILGSRGPFLVCSRRGCPGRRELSSAADLRHTRTAGIV